MPSEHRRVLQLIADCGTGRLGTVSYRCARCQAEGRSAVHFTNASCGNRHCPNCQTAANGDWCLEQTKKLLPCEYFLVTFTIPEQLRPFVRSHQNVCYRAMFSAAAFAIRTVLADRRFCGADETGFTAVLHTFGRDMNYHPHVHVILPGGGLRQGQWKSTLPGFLAPVKLLSKLFRMEFERLLRASHLAPESGESVRGNVLDSDFPSPTDFRRKFVSDVEAVGDGVSTLKYLSRYVSRTAITNDRIESMDTDSVTFRYRRQGEQEVRRMRLPAFVFLHRFLQHVLPRGLHRIRHYGLLSRCSKKDLNAVRAAILNWRADVDPDLELEDWSVPILVRRPDAGPRCPVCDHPLTFECFTRIRPPPLERRGRLPIAPATRSENCQN